MTRRAAPDRGGRGQHAVGVLEVAGQRLLHLHVAAGLEHPADDLAVGRRGHEHVDDVGVDREERRRGRWSPVRVREVRGPAGDRGRVEVAQPDDLDVVAVRGRSGGRAR